MPGHTQTYDCPRISRADDLNKFKLHVDTECHAKVDGLEVLRADEYGVHGRAASALCKTLWAH